MKKTYNLQPTTHNAARRHARAGVAALGTAFLVGGIVIEIGLAGLLAVTYLTSENFGVRRLAEARAAAASALHEALIRIVRNKNLPIGNSPSNWNRVGIDVGAARAEAVVCKLEAGNSLAGCATAGGASGGAYEIIATGRAFTKRHEIRAAVAVDELTGVVSLQSVREVPFDQ